METTRCYRFVKDDLSSEHGNVSWKISEWNQVGGAMVCCSTGLHATLTPRDSLRNVFGQRWFVSEARGNIARRGNKFSASEMRLVQEIPKEVLQRFAARCARDCLSYFESKLPEDKRLRDCIQATEDYLDGKTKVDELIVKRDAAAAAVGASGSADAARAAASAIAAAYAAHVAAAPWAADGAAAAGAAHVAAEAVAASQAAAAALGSARNVAGAVAAADADAAAASSARAAAAAAHDAHAAAVAAARGVPPADDIADAHAAYAVAVADAASDAPATRAAYAAHNTKLLELIDRHLAQAGV